MKGWTNEQRKSMSPGTGGPVDVCACWIRYLGGKDDAGKPIDVQDPMSELLLSKVRYGDTDPQPFLQIRTLFGDDLPHAHPFVEAVRHNLTRLYQDGARATVNAFLSGSD